MKRLAATTPLRGRGAASRRSAGRAARLVAALLLAALALPHAAAAHAVLEGSTPARGGVLKQAPGHVGFRFSEPVEAAFGSVRVFDGEGERVDVGGAEHPDGRDDAVSVALRDGLGDGTYTATYRVVSADSHPVAGGFVFSVGRAAAPAATLDELIDARGTGPATEVGFGVVRALSYLALALAVGGLAFVALAWRPALPSVAEADDRQRDAAAAFARASHRLVVVGAALGALTAALGIVFQGATAAGTSVWSALDPTVIGDVLDTRFGTVWGLRLLTWLAVGALVLVSPRVRLRRAAIGAHSLALAPAPKAAARQIDGAPTPTASRAARVPLVLALLLGFLCLTPALAGHASTLDPSWLLIPANAVHVVCMAIWVGGVATLLLAVPPATRRLEPRDRTTLLAAVLARFSSVALYAVAGLVAAGVLQAIVEIDALADLTGTAFGRAVLIKSALVLGLVALGAWNRRRALPRLRRQDEHGDSPGATGRALRRSLQTEIALMAGVLGVTAALAAYSPSAGAAGPFSTSQDLGPARMELTVDPGRAGPNEIHVYLFDRRSGRQWDRVKELDLHAALPAKRIGPLQLEAEQAGPGHWVVRRAGIAPAGDWRLELSARVSAFDAYDAELEVPIE